MYNKIKEINKYNGNELIEAITYICENIDTDIINYNTDYNKVYETLTKMCISINTHIYDNIDVVYCDENEEELIRYVCEKYGYGFIVYYGLDSYYDYWYIADGEIYENSYKAIGEYATYFLPDNKEIYNENTELIRYLINYYWDRIDYNYGDD